MRKKIFAFVLILLLLFCTLGAVSASAFSGVPSSLPPSSWRVDPARLFYRIEGIAGTVSGLAEVNSTTSVLVAHDMPWRTLAQYSQAVGSSALHYTVSLSFPGLTGSTMTSADYFAINFPFAVQYVQYGTLYFAIEFPSAKFYLADGSAVEFTGIQGWIDVTDSSGTSSRKRLTAASSTSFRDNKRVEYYANDINGTVSGVWLYFTWSKSSELAIDCDLSALFDMYMSAIYVEHAEGSNPVLIPPDISVPGNIIDIENDYNEAINGLYDDNWGTANILDILSSLTSHFNSVEMVAALNWWKRLFTALSVVEPVKTIFYTFGLVTVVTVILGLNAPAIVHAIEDLGKHKDDKDGGG